MTNIPKFRAYVPDQNYMGDVAYINFQDKELSFGVNSDQEELLCDFKDCILMQSTGLRDKNGTLIFCDDIVEFDEKEWGGNRNKFSVKWDDKNGCWNFGGGVTSEMEYRAVIGNIHQNQDILND